MKKLICFIIALGVALTAAAQPKAVGGRFGSSWEVSYQHYLGGSNFVEVDFGWINWTGVGLGATYDFSIVQPDWTEKGEWNVYAGPGLFLGGDEMNKAFCMGFALQAGLEYNFWFPLQLSVDIRPDLGFSTRDGGHFYNGGLWGFIPSLGVRYSF